MRQNNKKNNRKLGTAAVETALLFPVFILLLFGMIDAGRLYWTQSVVRDAAFEGARVAILTEATTIQIENSIAHQLTSGGLEQSSSISIGTREPEQPVGVTVSVPFDFLVIDNLIPALSDKNISATAVMTHER